MIANGIVISRIIYVIQLWGGTKDYLLQMLQVLQNKAARFVTKCDVFTSQKKLLLQCGWMSIKQLVEYHSLVLVYKTKSEQKPVFLHETLSKSFSYRTRASSTGSILLNQPSTGDISKESFVYKSTRMWNSLPPHIRKAVTLLEFKWKLKSWIMENIPQ